MLEEKRGKSALTVYNTHIPVRQLILAVSKDSSTVARQYCIQSAVHETKQTRVMSINIMCCILVIQGSVAQDLAGWRNQSDGSTVLPSDDDLGEGVPLKVRNRPVVISASPQFRVLTGDLSFRIVGHRIQSSEQRSKMMGRQKKRRCCKRAWRRRWIFGDPGDEGSAGRSLPLSIKTSSLTYFVDDFEACESK